MVAGTIIELNPLHKGHIEHFTETRRLTGCDKLIAVMSGNFVQRGEPAVFDKWSRAKAALEAGVDVVIELPAPYATAAADYFARGSVKLLKSTGVVDVLSFGSESGDLGEITKVANLLAKEPPEYKNELKNALACGVSFPAARATAVKALLENVSDELLTKPNNCLAIEYVKALALLGGEIGVCTTHRKAGGPSASKMREEMKQVGKVPSLDDFTDIFKYLLYTKTDIAMNEGLHNRFRRLASEPDSLSGLISAVKTKRYTHTRLQREVLRLILGINEADMNYYEAEGGPQYIRILGFRCASLLSKIVKNAALPVITNGKAMNHLKNQGKAAGKMLEKELECSRIYSLLTGKAEVERNTPIRG